MGVSGGHAVAPGIGVSGPNLQASRGSTVQTVTIGVVECPLVVLSRTPSAPSPLATFVATSITGFDPLVTP